MPSVEILVASHGRLTFFNADDGQSGIEPWRSDGTLGGTYRLADLYPGAISSAPAEYTGFGDLVLFSAFTPLGHELAVSDGTPAGTHLLVDIRPGPANSYPFGFRVFRDEVLFQADDGSGPRMWRTDGTAAGTYPHSILPFGATFVLGAPSVVAGNKLFYWLTSSANHALWVWNGSAPPSLVVAFPVFGSPPASVLVGEFQDQLVFLSPPVAGMTRAWATDGSAAGTVQITAPASQLSQFAVVGNELWYVANFSPGGAVRATNGTLAGDRAVVSFSGSVWGLRAVGGRAFFNASGPLPGQLWTTDGTLGGTAPLGVLALGWPVAIGDRRVLFVASDAASGRELWTSDGTVAGTTRAVDLRPGPASAFGSLVTLVYAGGRLVTWADDGVVGTELFAVHFGAGTRRSGAGCSNGAVPELRATDPVLGGNLVLAGRTQWPSTPGFAAISPLATLPAFAVPGCEVHVDLGFAPILWPFTTDAAGNFSALPIAVPNAPFLDGFVFGAHALLPVPGAPLFGLALSNAVELTLGG